MLVRGFFFVGDMDMVEVPYAEAACLEADCALSGRRLAAETGGARRRRRFLSRLRLEEVLAAVDAGSLLGDASKNCGGGAVEAAGEATIRVPGRVPAAADTTAAAAAAAAARRFLVKAGTLAAASITRLVPCRAGRALARADTKAPSNAAAARAHISATCAAPSGAGRAMAPGTAAGVPKEAANWGDAGGTPTAAALPLRASCAVGRATGAASAKGTSAALTSVTGAGSTPATRLSTTRGAGHWTALAVTGGGFDFAPKILTVFRAPPRPRCKRSLRIIG